MNRHSTQYQSTNPFQPFSDVYRYGFNGVEEEKEIMGERIGYAFEYRFHETRIGRFMSIDPLAASYPWNSPYAFAENRVIDGKDLEGLEYANATSPNTESDGENTSVTGQTNFTPSTNLTSNTQSDYNSLDLEFLSYKLEGVYPNVKIPAIANATLKAKPDNAHLTSFEKGMHESLMAGLEVMSYVEGGAALKSLYQGGVKFLKLANVTDEGLEFVGYSTDEVADTYVYMSRSGGKTTYVGISTNVAKRQIQHGHGRIIEKISETKLSRYDARAVEQVLIEHYGLAKNGGTLENKINSIAKSNKIYSDALKRGAEVLEQLNVPLN